MSARIKRVYEYRDDTPDWVARAVLAAGEEFPGALVVLDRVTGGLVAVLVEVWVTPAVAS